MKKERERQRQRERKPTKATMTHTDRQTQSKKLSTYFQGQLETNEITQSYKETQWIKKQAIY